MLRVFHVSGMLRNSTCLTRDAQQLGKTAFRDLNLIRLPLLRCNVLPLIAFRTPCLCFQTFFAATYSLLRIGRVASVLPAAIAFVRGGIPRAVTQIQTRLADELVRPV